MPSWRCVRPGPRSEVQAALEAALQSSDADIRQLALESLGQLFGVGARPYWQAWLASSSAPQRMAAEDVIGTYGDADDVPLAAEHLGKIIRRKSSISWEPPRGNEIITLLVRHRELPEAQAALADLTKRWPKLPDELQAWLREHHPDLVPAEPAAAPTASAEAEALEPALEWPLPEIKRQARGTTWASGTRTCSMSGIGSRTFSRRIRPSRSSTATASGRPRGSMCRTRSDWSRSCGPRRRPTSQLGKRSDQTTLEKFAPHKVESPGSNASPDRA